DAVELVAGIDEGDVVAGNEGGRVDGEGAALEGLAGSLTDAARRLGREVGLIADHDAAQDQVVAGTDADVVTQRAAGEADGAFERVARFEQVTAAGAGVERPVARPALNDRRTRVLGDVAVAGGHDENAGPQSTGADEIDAARRADLHRDLA